MSEVRLIDANAVKYKNLAEVNGRLTYVLTAEEIDNAPTVELFCHYQYDGEAKEPCVEGPCPHERPQGECENCDYRNFSETFIKGVVEVMVKHGITSVEQLYEILKGGAK